jgi:hypothetical protein
VIERRGRARLALEAVERGPITAQLSGQELEGHATAQARVLGLKDHAHAAGAKLSNDVVVGNPAGVHLEPAEYIPKARLVFA